MAEGHTYILNLPPHLRNLLVDDAHSTARSMNEVIKQALCFHYGMDCPEISRGRRKFDASATVGLIPVRVSEELFDRVRKEAAWTARSMRQVIVDVLESSYELKAKEAKV